MNLALIQLILQVLQEILAMQKGLAALAPQGMLISQRADGISAMIGEATAMVDEAQAAANEETKTKK